MVCIYCKNKKLYQLSVSQVKCARCKKKFSIAKLTREDAIRECFENGMSANECAQKLSFTYVTILKYYNTIRKEIIQICEDQFEGSDVKGYDEYIYIEKSKLKQKQLHNAKDFITFEYGDNNVYNLLLPKLDRYKNLQNRELKQFLGLHKLQSKEKTKTTIEHFWVFFENEIVKYKGVSEEYFFDYLKEIEWRFNRGL